MALLLITIYFVLPIAGGIIFKQKLKIAYEFGDKRTERILKEKSYRWKLLLCGITFSGSFYLIALTALAYLGILDINDFYFQLIYKSTIIINSITAYILIFRDLESSILKIMSHWAGKLAFTFLLIVTNVYASAYSLNYIESITGYSSSNFHSAEHLKLLFSVIIFLYLSAFFSLLFLTYYQIKIYKNKDSFFSEIENYINNEYIKPIKGLCCIYLYLFPIIIGILISSVLDSFFVNTFVDLNFHNYKGQCEKIEKERKVAILSRNKIDGNNYLIATKSNNGWNFKSVNCD